jgi:hypothetical protein
MRLDFNVLWVDDQPARVAAQISAIKKDMEDEGFDFKPVPCKTMAELTGKISDNVFTDEIDLVLVDWDLGEETKGQQVIAKVRQRLQYKDVVFYSANTAPGELRKLAFEAGLEGVFCSDRDGLRIEVIGVFESLVKKVLDIDHTRGIVMGATSDIDQMVHECVVAIHDKHDEAGKSALVSGALKIIEDRVKSLSKQLDKLKEDKTMSTLLKAHMMFTAADRLRILARHLKEDGKHGTAHQSVTMYLSDVVPRRNNLGHKVLLPDGKSGIAAIEGDAKISLEEMRELRRTILGLRGDFRSLVTALKS